MVSLFSLDKLLWMGDGGGGRGGLRQKREEQTNTLVDSVFVLRNNSVHFCQIQDIY